MKFYLQIGCLISVSASLLFTAILYGNGESWPRIWNQTFILWVISIILFIIYFIKFKKKN